MNKLTPALRSKIKKEFNAYMRGGFTRTNPGISEYSLRDLAPKFRQRLRDAIDNSLAMIKTQSEKVMLELEQRFRNWVTIPSVEMRGSLTDKDKMLSHVEKEIIAEPEIKKESDKHLQFVITDQTRKMLGSMDRIAGEDNGAIGFTWHTRRDQRVVGNPGGLYPEVKDEKLHGNHYSREGEFYLLRDSWAIKKGYIVARAGIEYADKIPDGLPSQPIGCRCYQTNIFTLEDIPGNAKDIITKKGNDYIRANE